MPPAAWWLQPCFQFGLRPWRHVGLDVIHVAETPSAADQRVWLAAFELSISDVVGSDGGSLGRCLGLVQDDSPVTVLNQYG